jgi:hypothetical protein
MKLLSWPALALGLFALIALNSPNVGTAQALATEKPNSPAFRDGQHDFDFAIGTWKTHISVLQQPLSGSTASTKIEGTAVIRKVWDGRADLEEIEGESATGHFEGMTLRLYNPQSHQWNLYWANGKDGTLAQAMVGEFKDGRGVFYDQEFSNGRAILSRNIYFDITPNSYRFEQAFSDDGGQTWEINFTAALTREERDADEAKIQGMGAASERQHDFDWQFGDWKVHMSRLEHPLTGSKTWTPIDGTVMVRKIWNGRANLAEIEVSGPLGHLEFLSLRLYNPQTREWSLIFANSNKGVVGEQMYGTFKGGRGVFYAQESLNGKRIFVRFVFSDATATSAKDEQAYSEDGGKTWEGNWRNVHALQRRQ